MRAKIRRWFEILLPGVLATMAFATTINFVLIGGALADIQEQAEEGQRAHARQCKILPVALKVYRAAERYDLISPEDLRTVKQNVPRDCKR